MKKKKKEEKKKLHKEAWSIESIIYKITFQNVSKSELKLSFKLQSFPWGSPDFCEVQYRHNPLVTSPLQSSLSEWELHKRTVGCVQDLRNGPHYKYQEPSLLTSQL